MKPQYLLLSFFAFLLCACQKQSENVTETPARIEVIFDLKFDDNIKQKEFEQALKVAAQDLGEINTPLLSGNINGTNMTSNQGRYTVKLAEPSVNKIIELKHRLGIEPSSIQYYSSSKVMVRTTETSLP